MNRHNYGPYRGRTTVRDILKGIIVLLVILLVALVGFLLFFQRYIVYTEDGIRLDLPFLQQEDVPPGASSVPVQIVEIPGGSEEEPQPPAQDETVWLRAVTMPLEELASGGVQALEQAGANTVVLDMKQDDGTLNYPSQQALAGAAGAGADQTAQLVEQLHQVGITAVARVSCFRDNALGSSTDYAILTNSGYRWCYDSAGLFWTSPANSQVRDYLVGVAQELAELGFDEILLDNWSYPTQGELGWIRQGAAYDPANLSGVIGDFLSQMSQALADTDAVLSLRVSPQVLSGQESGGGQDASAVGQYVSRAWLTQAAGEGMDLSLDGARLVLPVSSFAEGEEHQLLQP